jgi:hypothetical protein
MSKEIAGQLLTRFDTLSVSKIEDQKLPSPREIARIGAEKNLALAKELLGDDHPYIIHEKKKMGKLDRYVEVTSNLLDDAIGKWGGILEIDESAKEDELKNLIDYDVNRYNYLSALDSITSTLITGEWREDGKIDVPYREVATGDKGAYPFTQGFAIDLLEYSASDKEEAYEVYKDARVPFIFLLEENLDVLEDRYKVDGQLDEKAQELMANLKGYFGQSIDLIAKLYNGQQVELSDDAKENYHDLRLSEETRNELGKVGCIVLHPYYGQHVTDDMNNKDEPGTLLVPIFNLPWITPEGHLSYQFANWNIPNFEHETQHLSDFRVYDGAPISGSLLEIRAFSKQVAYQKQNGMEKAAKHTEKYLAPYVKIIKGTLDETPHVDVYYLHSLESSLSQLPEDKAEVVKQKLEEYKAKYHITDEELEQ